MYLVGRGGGGKTFEKSGVNPAQAQEGSTSKGKRRIEKGGSWFRIIFIANSMWRGRAQAKLGEVDALREAAVWGEG